jgi:deoxyribonuclease (pyrimidine dimer)
MTRINILRPEYLADQHLLAEYRELPRVFDLALRWLERTGGDTARLPGTYRLGKGHVMFFYDKMDWCVARQRALIEECLRRGFDIAHTEVPEDLPEDLCSGWNPTSDDTSINLSRLCAKQAARPLFYRMRGKPLARNYYLQLLMKGTR